MHAQKTEMEVKLDAEPARHDRVVQLVHHFDQEEVRRLSATDLFEQMLVVRRDPGSVGGHAT